MTRRKRPRRSNRIPNKQYGKQWGFGWTGYGKKVHTVRQYNGYVLEVCLALCGATVEAWIQNPESYLGNPALDFCGRCNANMKALVPR